MEISEFIANLSAKSYKMSQKGSYHAQLELRLAVE